RNSEIVVLDIIEHTSKILRSKKNFHQNTWHTSIVHLSQLIFLRSAFISRTVMYFRSTLITSCFFRSDSILLITSLEVPHNPASSWLVSCLSISMPSSASTPNEFVSRISTDCSAPCLP